MASSTRFRAPSFSMMLARCAFTVPRLTCSSLAISTFVSPRATAVSTSSSRGVNGSVGVRRLGSRSGGCESGQEPHGDCRVDQRVPGRRGVDRLGEEGGAGILQQEAAGSGLKCRVDVLVEVEGRDHDDRQRVGDGRAGEAARGFESVEAGHPDVEQADIRSQLVRQPDRLVAVGGLPDDLDVGLRVEDQAQTGADDRLVVGDEHSDHRAPPTSGSDAVTVQPPPASGPAWNSPPSSRARSRMPMMP